MVDNFNKILSMLGQDELLSEDNYYHVQVLKRGKDSNETGSRLIKDYYIRNASSLISNSIEIKTLCDTFGARAYINVNVKSWKKTYSFVLKRMGDIFDNNNYSSMKSILSSAAGNVSTRDKNFDKVWIIDYDEDDTYDLEGIKLYLYGNNISYIQIPTKNGLHLLVNPFRLDMCPFSDKVHKHNPTILYIGE